MRKLGCIVQTHQTVDGSDYFADQVGHISNQTNQERVQVQRVKHALNNRDQVTQSHDQLEININIGNGDIDLVNSNLDTSIDLNQTSHFCVEVKIGPELLDVQFDPAYMQFRDAE